MKRWVGIAIRVVLGVIFLYAGLVKASSSQQFALGLVPFTFLPVGLTGLLAVAIAWSEVVAGVLILLPRVYLAGAAMIGGLVLLFITALSWALWNGIVIPCSCFGDGAEASVEAMIMAIVRDVFILAGVVVLALLSRKG
jgi:uncharacterized membrane protein YphA (DoxX/SURF4 family)